MMMHNEPNTAFTYAIFSNCKAFDLPELNHSSEFVSGVQKTFQLLPVHVYCMVLESYVSMVVWTFSLCNYETIDP